MRAFHTIDYRIISVAILVFNLILLRLIIEPEKIRPIAFTLSILVVGIGIL